MSRTPEETARLALTVSVNGPEGPVVLAAMARKTFAEALDWSGRWAPAVALAYCAADLAEAGAEVAALRQEHEAEANAWEREVDVARHQIAALRGHVKLLAEWQAAMAERSRTFEAATDTIDPEAMAEHEAAEIAVEDIEARMLAADLGEEAER